MNSTLMFHGIGEPDHDMEYGEENFWISWNQFNAIVDYLSDICTPCTLITFDDGNTSDYHAALNLRSRGLVAKFFVLVGRLDKPGYLTSAQIEEMQEMGMEIGLHGRRHSDWRKVDDEVLTDEVEIARYDLERICGRSVRSLAIPYGLYNKRVWNYLKGSTFEKIYTSDPGYSQTTSKFQRRHAVMKWTNIDDIDAVINRKSSIVSLARQYIAPIVKRNIP